MMLFRLSACGRSFVGLPRRSLSAPAMTGALALSNIVIADLVLTISGVASPSLLRSGDFGVSPAEESSISGLGLRGVLKREGLGGRGLLGEVPITRDFVGDELKALYVPSTPISTPVDPC